VLATLVRSRAVGASDLARLLSDIGRVAVGMARQGFDLQLTRYDEKGWRATFYTTGMEHSPASSTGPDGSARRGTRRSGLRGRALKNAK
jgi:hypothetical protein